MTAKIELYGGTPPHCETGFISQINELKTKQHEVYAKVLLEVPQGPSKSKTVENLPFFFAPKIWQKYKRLFKVGDVWTFQFNLTSNVSGNNHFLNAAVVRANSIKIKIANENPSGREFKNHNHINNNTGGLSPQEINLDDVI